MPLRLMGGSDGGEDSGEDGGSRLAPRRPFIAADGEEMEPRGSDVVRRGSDIVVVVDSGREGGLCRERLRRVRVFWFDGKPQA